MLFFLLLISFFILFYSIILFFGRRGLTDELGAEAMMFDALEKIENELKKPLLRNDKKGTAVLMAEFDKINKKYEINYYFLFVEFQE